MELINFARERRKHFDLPIIESENGLINFHDIQTSKVDHLFEIKEGDVVALIGDFDSQTLANLLFLIERNAIVMPLSMANSVEHKGFFDICKVDWVVNYKDVERLTYSSKHELIRNLQIKRVPGLVLFSSGSSGKPKAILHDFSIFMNRFRVPSKPRKTMNFLLFDHIGGLNTFFHTFFNSGTIVPVIDRTPTSVISICNKSRIELLPTTPTFLRMLLLTGISQSDLPDSLKIITYGTERMQQVTLDQLCEIFPKIDFRQTYGLSELGILKVKSEHRQSLFVKIGGDGVTIRFHNNELIIKSANRMMGYLNEATPFDADGWYKTGDKVELKGEYFRINGRVNEIINVAGLKFMPLEIENVALNYGYIHNAKAYGRSNPITGNHVELTISPDEPEIFNIDHFKNYLEKNLPKHKLPNKIIVKDIGYNHRFKQNRE